MSSYSSHMNVTPWILLCQANPSRLNEKDHRLDILCTYSIRDARTFSLTIFCVKGLGGLKGSPVWSWSVHPNPCNEVGQWWLSTGLTQSPAYLATVIRRVQH